MRNAPLFIVGPPRSGTTLLGQVVGAGLDVAHIPTLAIRLSRYFSQRPPLTLIARLAILFGREKNGATRFASTYGASHSLSGASDSDPIWRKALPEGYLEQGVLSLATKNYVYRQFSGLERVFGRPVIDKSVGHSLRIPALLEIFPDALFIRCRRDVLAVAQSVWIGRGDFPNTRWPTPKARGYEALQRSSREEQAAGQQYLFEKDIDAGLSTVDPDRVADVEYADLCSAPKREISRIRTLMLRAGIEVQLKADIPARFENRHVRRIPKDNYEEIIGYLEHYWGRSIERLSEPSSENDTKSDSRTTSTRSRTEASIS